MERLQEFLNQKKEQHTTKSGKRKKWQRLIMQLFHCRFSLIVSMVTGLTLPLLTIYDFCNLHYYSTIVPFYHIRAKEHAKYAMLLHCRTGQKYGLTNFRNQSQTY